jgi:hypothetical protein
LEDKESLNQKLRELSSKDLFSSIFLIAACIFVIIVSLRMRVYNTYLDSPAIFPITVASIIGLSSVFLLIDSIKRGALQEMIKVWGDRNKFLRNITLKRIILIVGILIIYGFFLVQHIHYTLATFIFLAGIMAYLKIKWLYIVLISAGVSLSISYAFGTLFNIPLP